MTRTLVSSILLASWLLFCHTSAPAAPADGEMQALMREAFPGWKAKQMRTITAPGPDGERTLVAVTPQLVLPLDGQHRALIVGGVRVIEGGQRIFSHSAEGNLGVYLFEQRDSRWVKTKAMPSVGWTGFEGELGKLRAVTLGANKVGLAVENGSCWQGFCGDWLKLYSIDTAGAREVLSLMTQSYSTTTTELCTDWLRGRLNTAPERYDPTLCFDVHSHWQLDTASGDDWADITVYFTGRDAALNRRGKPVAKPVHETLVLRYSGAGYKPVQGRNPTHTF